MASVKGLSSNDNVAATSSATDTIVNYVAGDSNLDTQIRQRKTNREATTDDALEEVEEDISKEKNIMAAPVNPLLRLESVVMPIAFTLLAMFIRMYKIGINNHVVWDEAHFGKFGSYYLKHEFYHDVHPPLGKMLVGLSGYLAGYNGSFSFGSGEEYPEYLDFVKMRVFNAVFSSLCVPIAYFTGKAIGFSLPATWFFTVLVLFENSYTTLGKFILLDSMLLFFTVASFYCFIEFHNQRSNPFTANWWKWMILTGFNLGCAISVKMVGLFIITLVGIYTAVDLWSYLGNKKMSWKTYGFHWISRIFGLIMVPMSVFVFSFYCHFTILTNSGTGDNIMPSLFQAGLNGSSVGLGPRNVAIGSTITLKNIGLRGALLHSHGHIYPEGSKQQQITGYSHNDTNNEWYFDRVRDLPYFQVNDTDIEYVKDDYVYRLVHKNTQRNLHSHPVNAPISNAEWEVSAYGNATIGDPKDYWIVEIVDQIGDEDATMLHPLTTSFRLKHGEMDCYLTQTGNSLPEWGFKQREIACVKNPSKKDKRAWWNIESHENALLPDPSGEFVYPKMSFLACFLHLNLAMMASNNALIPENDKWDPIASSAWQWPTLNLGLRICSWADDFPKYFLLGTPVSTWGSSITVIGFMIFVVIILLKWQRQYSVLSKPSDLNLFLMGGFYPLLAWGLHYTPFVIMSRVTYVHHYLPALYFALIILTYSFDAILNSLLSKNKMSCTIRYIVFLLASATVIWCFLLFSPISFGMIGPAKHYKYLQWVSTWRIFDE